MKTKILLKYLTDANPIPEVLCVGFEGTPVRIASFLGHVPKGNVNMATHCNGMRRHIAITAQVEKRYRQLQEKFLDEGVSTR